MSKQYGNYVEYARLRLKRTARKHLPVAYKAKNISFGELISNVLLEFMKVKISKLLFLLSA